MHDTKSFASFWYSIIFAYAKVNSNILDTIVGSDDDHVAETEAMLKYVEV